jgi:hypothetical protein
MNEESAQVFLPPRERCFERLCLARFGETVMCVHCESDAVVDRELANNTKKEARRFSKERVIRSFENLYSEVMA